ncbi:MAG: hypothetical protein H7X93_06825, partial [Sphingomonadaceae bacterium]|nr:hypothetical protein [Sphingomonadaceae bacterium]
PEPAERPPRPAERRRGSRLAGIDDGIGQNPSRSTERSASAATVTGAQRSSYTALIGSQIRPCVDRQTPPGPGAERIRTSLSLRFNADGTLAGRPSVRRQTGYDDSSARYRERVGELAVASVMACTPIRGLPADLYRTRSGQGWHSVDVAITIDPRG